MAHITSLVIEKVQFNHFLIKSLWKLSVAMATKLRDRSPNFLLFGIVLSQAIFMPIVLLLQWFWRSCHLKTHFFFFFFLNLMLTWQPNKIATGHQTYKLGRPLSKDHNCQIWFTPLHWLWRKCNLTIFPL